MDYPQKGQADIQFPRIYLSPQCQSQMGQQRQWTYGLTQFGDTCVGSDGKLMLKHGMRAQCPGTGIISKKYIPQRHHPVALLHD